MRSYKHLCWKLLGCAASQTISDWQTCWFSFLVEGWTRCSNCKSHLVDMMEVPITPIPILHWKTNSQRLELPNWRFSEGGRRWGGGHFQSIVQLRMNKNGKQWLDDLFLDFDLSSQHIYPALNTYSKVSAFSSTSLQKYIVIHSEWVSILCQNEKLHTIHKRHF